MKKVNLKRGISFLLTVCLLAGNSYININVGEPTVTMSEWTEVTPGENTAGQDEYGVKKPFLFEAFDKYFGIGDRFRTAQAAGSERYVFIQPDSSTNNIVESNSTVELTTATSTLFVSKVDENNVPIEFNKNVSVNVYSGNESVVSVDPYDAADPNQSQYARTLRRQGPGYAQVTAVITDPDAGTSTIITCLIHVELRLVEDDTEHWKAVDLDGDKRVLVLNQKNEKNYQLSLKYVDNQQIQAADLTWKFSKDGVISIDSAGVLTVLGAGHTTVTITTDTNNGQSKADTTSFEVIVTPIGSNNVQAPNPPADPSEYEKFDQTVNMFVDNPYFTIYSNGHPASNMEWEVYSVDVTGKETLIKPSDKTLLEYTVSEVNGNVSFTGVKAGTYVVRGYVTDEYDETWAVVTYNVVVNLSLTDTTVYMNVGDTYSILNNSNIPEDLFSYLFTFTYVEKEDEFIAGIDRKTGLITALNKGTAEILMSYNKSSNSGIYDREDENNTNIDKQVTYTIKVIDGIALNSTLLSMYTGATYQMIAEVTDRTAAVTWTSSDPNIATVDNTGLVTALKATGSTRPVQIIASQTIDGVVKSAVCNIYIQPAVTEIVLSPSSTTLAIGEYETIKATVKPSGISGTVLRWISSDIGVFEVVEYTDLTATIEGKAGGVAVLTAINAENVVVGYCTVTVNQQAEGIKLSDTDVTVALSQKTYQLYATLTPANTTNTKLIWSSTDGKVATVDQNGKVTFKSAGRVSIAVQSQDNPALIAYCNFTIEKPVTNVALDKNYVELYTGESQRLTYLVYPNNATHLEVDWTSFDTKVVTVDDTGMLTAKGVGTTQIMIMTQDGSYYDICTVVVKQKAVSVKMNYTDITMNAGEYFDMEVTVAPATSTEKSLKWQSLNNKVVTVSSTGRITARAEGTAVVLVSTESGVTSYCTVTVLQPVISMELDPSEITIDVGESFEIEAIFKPENATNQEVTWESSDDSIAEVNAIGEVTGLSGGSAVIICETADGGYRSYCLVRVVEPVIEIVLSEESCRIGYNETLTLEAEITNHGTATDIGILWSSSDETVCTVDENGRIRGINYGTAEIMAEAADGYGAYAICEVEVACDVEITISPDNYRLGYGKRYTLTATITNRGEESNIGIVWSSSDESVCTVDQGGRIQGVDYGYATITAEAADGCGALATCEVRVVREVTSIKFNKSAVTVIQGQTFALQTTILPSNATYDTAIFTSSDDTIAMVDEDGIVTALEPGKVLIKAEARDNSGKFALCYVTVIEPVAATGVSVSDTELVLLPGEKKQVTASIKPVKSTDILTWSSNNEAIASVNGSGTITAHKTGKATITVMASSGKTAIVEVTVLGLSRTSIEMPLYTRYSKLTVDGATTGIRWDVEDSSICEVNNGVLTARKVGTTYVTATINGRTLRCKVKVTSNKKK